MPSPHRVSPSISPSHLLKHLSQPHPTPVLIHHLAATWPARREWSFSDDLANLRSHIGENTGVEVELGPRGRGYLDGRYKRVSMGFGLFLDAFILGKIPSSTPPSQQPVGYLAQHDIPLSSTSQQVPASSSSAPLDMGSRTTTSSIHDDLPSSPYFLSGPRSELWRRTLWIGPKGSFTPFHRDPYIGIYTQLVGRKRFHLLPPSSSPYLSISTHPPHTNTSSIPVSVSTLASLTSFPLPSASSSFSTTSSSSSSSPSPSPTLMESTAAQESETTKDDDPSHIAHQDLSDLPTPSIEAYASLLKNAFREPGACTADLGPGESVLIPEGWFHSAEGLERGVGVNVWFR